MTEIAINRCPRGHLLSEDGCIEYAERKGAMPEDLDRSCPVLVAMLKEDLTKRKWAGSCSHVEIVSIPDGMPWKLMNRGNFEWVASGGE